jgi:hypothetical protein
MYDFLGSSTVPSVIQCISWVIEDLRCQVAGLFANLSEHIVCQSMMVSNRIVIAIYSFLAIEEHNIMWQDCSRTHAHLCDNKAKQSIIHSHGGLKILSILIKSNSKVCERYVAIALKFMSLSPEVQKSLSKKKNHISHLLIFLPVICVISRKLLLLHLLPCCLMKLGDYWCCRKVSSVHTSRHGHLTGCRILCCKLCFVTRILSVCHDRRWARNHQQNSIDKQ